MDQSSTRTIRRKPIPSKTPHPPVKDVEDTHDILDDLLDDYLEPPTSHQDHVLPTGTKELTLTSNPPPPPRQLSIPLVTSPSEISLNSNVSTPETPNPNPNPASNPNPSQSKWKTALDETIYFAGGLISHPFESTKHYSILRHSAGVVLYRGPSTSIAVTVFSDEPLPADRSFWLQRKGFSGNMGMAASALLRTQWNWIDVTPSFEAKPSDVLPSDERAWQRDIKKFLKKASSHRHLSKHIARETCVVRIPASAEDGYLRIVMCMGEGAKKTLCPSPIFRVASTSSDVSVLRGASLTTIPLEIGLKVASVVGTSTVDKFVSPARDAIQSRLQQYAPGFVAQEAGTVAYETLEEKYDENNQATYESVQTEGVIEAPPQIVGADSGPEKPYPFRFAGRVIEGAHRSRTETGIPTANLSGVPNDLLLRLNGVYIGWAQVQPTKGIEGVLYNWHEAIITIGPSPYAPPRVVAKNVAAVHIIHDFGDASFFNTELKVVVMAYLRPISKHGSIQTPAATTASITRDISTTIASLDRENWQCEMTLRRVKTEQSTRSVGERYVDVRSQVQRRVDSVPLHLAGVRTASAEVKDQAYGRGGLYIRR
ncbi:uncharacterized protein GGS22DRAFT_53492 [Annulohypoxylon maeteangense]|uniref:uncharacterized protein n=1 Tax=Annulohypoxylon maeteangense TaxID=1927788 RepID=UPI00200731C6|nr:uncharacterized protein GGS22DRAFT_53492 [Annulohypoxylon maeteangense]KAI0882006.1 hypothetical protein GGS22DRAFT_53492 [Annulohypoxylon maeteangense]